MSHNNTGTYVKNLSNFTFEFITIFCVTFTETGSVLKILVTIKIGFWIQNILVVLDLYTQRSFMQFLLLAAFVFGFLLLGIFQDA